MDDATGDQQAIGDEQVTGDDRAVGDEQAIGGSGAAIVRILIGLVVMGTITILLSFGTEGLTDLFV